jgi:hypothetical protein
MKIWLKERMGLFSLNEITASGCHFCDFSVWKPEDATSL